jgi:hypothetical protein
MNAKERMQRERKACTAERLGYEKDKITMMYLCKHIAQA